MLDQLLNLVKENAQDLIVNNQAIPNQFNDAAIGEAGNAIHDQLSQAVNGGNLQDVLGIFGNSRNLTNNPLVGNIVSQLAGSLGGKFGVDGTQARNIAGKLIPQILGQLTDKTNNPNNSSFNINDIMGHLSGGGNKGIDFGKIVQQMQQGGGGVDFGNLAGQLSGGNKGGLGDVIGGFFKK